jgi:hypothetical protein
MDGMWAEEALSSSDDQAWTDTHRNTGGLFGGAAVVNVANGTMFSYDALAIQGYDKSEARRHNEPGTIHPSLNDGSEQDAWVFFGVPQNKATKLSYNRPVDAISAIFMHENIMNEYTLETIAGASTEWIVTMPTKSFYVDDAILYAKGEFIRTWIPDSSDEVACKGWKKGDPNPLNDVGYMCDRGFMNNQPAGVSDVAALNTLCGEDWSTEDVLNNPNKDRPDEYENCNFIFSDTEGALRPFAEVFDGESCDAVDLETWDREEGPPGSSTTPGKKPPVVSPSLPTTPSRPSVAPFELCYEVNLIRFGEDSVFGSELADDGGLVYSVSNIAPESGWGRVTLAGSDGLGNCVACGSKTAGYPEEHVDSRGLLGLPVTGFAAETYTNGFVMDGVLANYGGLFNHKGSVACDYDEPGDCGSGTP